MLGKWVEYRDKNEATRIGKATKYYGSHLTCVMKYHRTILCKARVHNTRLLRVKVRRRWVPIAEFLVE